MRATRTSTNNLLEATPPQLSATTAAALAWRYFAIEATASELASERDRNYYLATRRGDAYVLKAANPAEPASVTDLQTRAMRHVETTDPVLPIPRIVPTKTGDEQVHVALDDGRTSVVRVVTFLEGEPLHRARATLCQQRNIGNCAARLGLALRDFHHAAADHELLWDIKNAGHLHELLTELPELPHRDVLEHGLDEFLQYAEPALAERRTQVVHNDINAHNLLVNPLDHDQINGLIDFGDIVRTPLINDVAVAAAYQVAGETGTLGGLNTFIAGYHAIAPLEPVEVDLLFDLIRARLIATIVIGSWRAQRHDHNRRYILRNSAPAWAGLERLTALSRPEAQAMLRRACDMGSPA